MEVENADKIYDHFRNKGISFEVDVRAEDWRDRHFVIVDPNGIEIDFVSYTEPEE